MHTLVTKSLLLLLLGLLPSSGDAGMGTIIIILTLSPVHYILVLPHFPYLFYTSLSTWFSVFLSRLFPGRGEGGLLEPWGTLNQGACSQR